MDDREADRWGATLLDHLAELVVVVDHGGMIRYANATAEELLSMRRSDWIGRPAVDIVHPEDLSLALELLVTAKATGEGIKEPVTFRLRTGDRGWLPVEVVTRNVAVAGGELVLVMSGREIARRRSGEVVLSEAGQRIARMFDEAAIGMAQIALDGRVLRVNRCFAEMLGVRPDDLVATSFAAFAHPDDRGDVLGRFAELASGTVSTYRCPLRYIGASGRVVHVELTVALVPDHVGMPLYCAAQAIDVTELREAQAELMHRSTHDPLTGLANRALLHSLLGQALSRAARRNESIAVLFVDLDRFKSVNDSHGHAAGDELLVKVADRLRACVRNGDVVSRLGGDEFVVICESITPEAAEVVAEGMLVALAQPYHLMCGTMLIGASIGLAIEPAGGVSADHLIHCADSALYRSKRRGRGRVTVHGVDRASPLPSGS